MRSTLNITTRRFSIKHAAASSEVLKALFRLLVFNQPAPRSEELNPVVIKSLKLNE